MFVISKMINGYRLKQTDMNQVFLLVIFCSIINHQIHAAAMESPLTIPWLSAPDFTKENPKLEDFSDEAQDVKFQALSKQQRQHAKTWGLDEHQESRFIQLMNSRSGIYYRGLNLSPIDILGLNARSQQEREALAKLAARLEAQKVMQNIAWNNAFYQAYNDLFKNVPVVGDFDPWPYSPYAHKVIQLNQGDALFLFVHEKDAIKTTLLMLQEAVQKTPKAQLHILFVDMSDDEIELWANRHQLPKPLIASHQITLQAGAIQYQSLAPELQKTPLLLLSDGKSSHRVDLGRV